MTERAMAEECQWLQEVRANATFREVENLLRDCSKRLSPSASGTARGVANERYTLTPRSGQDNLKTSVVLYGDSIQSTEISLKFAKNPASGYKGTATPEVHWKLQQLQDASNFCVKALQLLLKGIKKYEAAIRVKGYTQESGELLVSVLNAVKDAIKATSSALMSPRRKSLLELCQFHPTKSFNPPLPNDVLLSYYIASTKLVCAVYHVNKAPNGGQTVTIYQAESPLPYLSETLLLLDNAFSLTHSFISNYAIVSSSVK
jgi:hypothetical protein